MAKFYDELEGFRSHTIANEIGVHFTTVYQMVKRNDPRIQRAIKSLKDRGVEPEMLTGKSSLLGFEPELIAEKSGFCRATIYNFANGNTSPETTAKIQSVIDELKIEKYENHRLQQEPELEGSISDRS